MASKSISKSLIWILFGLLILGLGGYGVTNLGGTIRSIGSVGDVAIDVNDYARGLQREIRAIEAERGASLSFSEAREIGVTQAVLARLVAAAAFDHETGRIGLSVGDATLREKIVGIEQFRGLDGAFDREAYRSGLDQAGLTESQFEAKIRAEAARGILQGAVLSGVRIPDAYTATLTDYLGERREVAWAVLDRGDLATGLPVPEAADLAAYHGEHAARYTLPERKRIAYAWLAPEMVMDSVEVDEAALRAAYEARADAYNTPERRLVERLAFADAAAAGAARARLDAGAADFETLVAERGLDLADTDLGDVTRADLGAAADTVFAAAVGEVAGPAQSPVGPALFRINARLAAQATSFEQARPELREELVADRARRAVEARIDAIDDLLAGGATIEDLAREAGMRTGTIDWHEGISEGIAAYEAFRAAAAGLTPGDYPKVIGLEDGGIFAMRLDATVPPELQPLAEVQAAVAVAWSAEKLIEELKKQTQPLVSKLASGLDFKAVGLVEDGRETLTRRSFRVDFPTAFIDFVFSMDEGGIALLEGAEQLFVVRLERIAPPDPEDTDLRTLRERLHNQAAAGLAQDLFQLMADDIRARAGIVLDEAALNAVHANFQ